MASFYNDIWFGDVKTNEEIQQIRDHLFDEHSEKELVIIITELLKVGDFSIKPALIELLNMSEDKTVLEQCIRLFLAVATHTDFKELNHFKFLEDADADIVEIFASYSSDSLSMEVVPYLLALLEVWDGTDTGNHIRDSLDFMLDYQEKLDIEASVDEIGNFYSANFVFTEEEAYVYRGQPIFLGNLTKLLTARAYAIVDSDKELNMLNIPELLSIYSGIKCPISYHDRVTKKTLDSIYRYVDELKSCGFQIGEKYFYGHLIK